MHTKILAGLALVAMLAAPVAEAQPAPTHIRLMFVITPGAFAYADANLSAVDPYNLAKVEMDDMQKVFTDSQVPVIFDLAVVYSGWNPGTTTLANALVAARYDKALMTLRDGFDADMIVLITDNYTVDNVNGKMLHAATYGQCTTDPQMAITAVKVKYLPWHSGSHEAAHIMCATHEKGYQQKVGATVNDCTEYVDLMARPIDRIWPALAWTISEGGLSGVTGGGVSAGEANVVMSAGCADFHGYGPFWTYECGAMSCGPSSINPPVPGAYSMCTHSRKETYAPPWGITIYNSTQTTPASAVRADFLCPNFETIVDVISNPDLPFKGFQLGDAQHNNVAAIKAALPVVKNFHLTKIAPTLH